MYPLIERRQGSSAVSWRFLHNTTFQSCWSACCIPFGGWWQCTVISFWDLFPASCHYGVQKHPQSLLSLWYSYNHPAIAVGAWNVWGESALRFCCYTLVLCITGMPTEVTTHCHPKCISLTYCFEMHAHLTTLKTLLLAIELWRLL